MKAAQKHQRRSRDLKRAAGQRDSETFTRSAAIERASIDEEARTAELSFSSEAAVQDRFYGPPTVLLHEAKAVDLKPLREVGALLMNHDADQIIGVPLRLEIDEETRKGRATVRFDEDAEGERAWQKVRSGSLKGVSVRFSIEKAQVIGEDEKWKSPGGREFSGPLEVATRWMPREISLTPIPADTVVGIGRNGRKETQEMRPETLERLRAHGLEPESFATEEAALAVLDKLDAAKRSEPAPVAPSPEPEPDPTPVSAGSARAERARAVELHEIAELVGAPELAREWIEKGTSPDDARKQALARRASENPPIMGPTVEVERDEEDKVRAFCEASLLRGNRIPCEVAREMEAELPARLPLEKVLYLLTPKRHRAPIWASRETHIARAFAHGTGGLTNVFANVLNKSVKRGYQEASGTYETWTYRKDVTDFKATRTLVASELENFVAVPDKFPIPESALSDTAETNQLVTYGRKLSLSRQAILSDDQSVLTDNPRKLGLAARRTINAAAAAVLGGTQTMAEDSEALFSSSHTSGDNLGTAGAPSITTIGELQKLMRLQKGLGAVATLGIAGKFLVVPAAHELLVEQIVNGTLMPATVATVPVNSQRNLIVVVEPALDALSSTAYYLVADPQMYGGIEVLRLAGQNEPEINQLEGHDVLGMSWAAYFDFGVKATDHRPLAKNAGA